jgi:RimJ/RimL family protein N-acetyltransferase
LFLEINKANQIIFLDQFGKFPLHTFKKFVMITSSYFIALKEPSVKETKAIQSQTSLLSPRLQLKELTVVDAENLFRYRSLPEVTRFQGWAPTSVEDAVRFIENDICHEMNQPDTWFQWGILLREGQTLIGDLGIHFLPDESTVEIGVTIAPEFQGRGLAAEAVACVMDFIFHTLHKSKVVASVDPMNEKSMALMCRVGFQLEGIYKNAVFFRGEWVDDAVFFMTRELWQIREKANL